MKEKGIFVLQTINGKYTMTYTTLDDKPYIITPKSPKNIADIKENNQVQFVQGKTQFSATATIITDIDIVKDIFDKMLKEENAYFTTFDKDFVAVELVPNE
jgi:uncharacterized pyridoxamine 5'-phosphate oxidase family protein